MDSRRNEKRRSPEGPRREFLILATTSFVSHACGGQHASRLKPNKAEAAGFRNDRANHEELELVLEIAQGSVSNDDREAHLCRRCDFAHRRAGMGPAQRRSLIVIPRTERE